MKDEIGKYWDKFHKENPDSKYGAKY